MGQKKQPISKIFLVRHGEVENPRQIIYGYLPLPLSAKGRTQITEAAGRLKGENIAVIFASPQKRTQESAKIISRIISGGKIKVRTDRELRESALGHFWERLTRPQAELRDPKIFKDYYRQPGKIKAGGESLADMAKRVLAVIKKEAKKHPGENLVFVSHQDPIMAALLKIAGRDFNDLHKTKTVCGTGAVCEIWSAGNKLINKTRLAA